MDSARQRRPGGTMDARAPGTKLTNTSFTKPRLAAFAIAALPAASLGLPLSVYLPNYYASHLGLNLAIVGASFSAVRLLDIFFDPFIGVVIDATRTPFG